jgi:hypothetical protein
MRTLSPEEHAELELEGARLAPLIVGWKWIDRRVESIRFLSETTALRDVGITLTLPNHIMPAIHARHIDPPHGTPASRQPFYYVPLTFMGKEHMTRFDFTNEPGDSLPLLSSTEKAAMAAGLLIFLAEKALAEQNMALPDVIANDFRAIAQLPPKQAAKLYDCFMARSTHPGVYAVLHGPARRARVLRALLFALANSYILIVPLSRGPHHKRLIKFSYEEPLKFRFRILHDGRLLRRWATYLGQFATEQMRAVGWKARQVWVATPALGHGGTYHFQLNEPSGTKVTQLTLSTLTVNPAMNSSESNIGISAHPEEKYSPRVYCRDASPGAFGAVYAKIRPQSPTVIRAALFSALGTAIVLGFGYHFLTHMLTEPTDLSTAGAALLLAGPTAASIYISRGQEHPMVTNMLLQIRVLSLVSGVSAFVAAGVLIVGRYSQHASRGWIIDARHTWLGCTGVAGLVALILIGTYFATWKEDQPLRSRWRHFWARLATPPTYPPPSLPDSLDS